jgi:hypothetical protein
MGSLSLSSQCDDKDSSLPAFRLTVYFRKWFDRKRHGLLNLDPLHPPRPADQLLQEVENSLMAFSIASWVSPVRF